MKYSTKGERDLPPYFEGFLKRHFSKVSDEMLADVFEVSVALIVVRRRRLNLFRVNDFVAVSQSHRTISNSIRAAIYEDYFCGERNHYALARKYKKAPQTIFNIIDSVSGDRHIRQKRGSVTLQSKINFEHSNLNNTFTK